VAESQDKARRQQEILDLVRGEEIASQDELAHALGRRGYDVAQSTLSRDLRELRVLRVPTRDGYRYMAAEEGAALNASAAVGRVSRLGPAEVLGVDSNETAIVIRTFVGRAQGVGVHLDGLAWPEILGTIAGDDTILVLPRSTKKIPHLRRRLAELFGLNRSQAAHR
jgi:transcriptional regulator of arginine metabolism